MKHNQPALCRQAAETDSAPPPDRPEFSQFPAYLTVHGMHLVSGLCVVVRGPSLPQDLGPSTSRQQNEGRELSEGQTGGFGDHT